MKAAGPRVPGLSPGASPFFLAFLPALALALLPPLSAAGPAASGGREEGARLFETLELSLESGILLPLGDLADILDPAPLAGFRLATSYYGDWRATASLAGAHLDGPGSPAAVGFAAAAAGLEWKGGPAWAPAAGTGLGLYYARATGVDRNHGEYLFLEDGESEFGMQASLRWGRSLGGSVGVETGLRWDLMLTAPEYSHMASWQVGVRWTP